MAQCVRTLVALVKDLVWFPTPLLGNSQVSVTLEGILQPLLTTSGMHVVHVYTHIYTYIYTYIQ